MPAVTVVSSTGVRLIDPNDVLSPVTDAIRTALYKDTDIVDEIMRTTKDAFNAQMDRYLQYGINEFELGLPSSEVSFPAVTEQNLIDVVTVIENQPITSVEWSAGAKPNVLMRAIEFMQWNQEYNPVTHEVKQLNARLEIPEGIPVYFEDAELAGITSIFITYKYTINGVRVPRGYLLLLVLIKNINQKYS